MSEIKLKPVLQEKVEEEKREKQRLKKQYGIEKADGVVVVEKVTIADKLGRFVPYVVECHCVFRLFGWFILPLSILIQGPYL